ncbi:SET domain-containing protein SmydA-8-like [Homarus americanus]|uniref:SET domain-containing protein SmydA-8-like 5 n=1 Tax=Homarus americanus TaxID=6706 RepID=A0A8J5NAS1_HOMAM|nr:SET domain-containing protein SmydA-8-like [Homarus americanus]XP_042203022.1 SET domain-containing protein SmydA-8-like [Homarus americanus]XP_042203031.1 SET domain-containing protein SmydA-8-like [Homarus americanus]KAG7176014.1 SET domain-containing protein SmydA-8-like 5 [Homarus americanus]
MTAPSCAVCGSPASQRCAKCHLTAYCSKDHQRQHWKTHRSLCSPYRVCQSEELGRYLEASRDILPGELILKDSPLVLGPRQVTVPVCLGCFTPVNGSYSCTLCGWPLCGPECQKVVLHYPECQLSRNRPVKVQVQKFMQVNQMYECITPLRCLWLKEQDPAKWSTLTQMESHLQERVNTDVYEVIQANVVDFSKQYLKVTSYTPEEIQTVCGIIEVNGFEIPGPNAIGVYGKACLLEHACIPNTTRTFDSQLNIIVRAAVKIPKGSHISTSYTDPMWGTANRQLHLKTSKYFKCTCGRCQDPTELGTHLSSLRCGQCPSGLVLPSPSPLTPEVWLCNSCSASLDVERVEEFLKQTGEKLVSLKEGSLAASESFLKATCSKLSENHYYRSDVKLAMAQMYGRGGGEHHQGDLQELSKDQLERKGSLSREVLALADIFSPGETRLRGLLKYELQAACREKYRRLPKKLKSSPQAKALLQECVECLQEASTILLRESPLQDEYQLALQAEADLGDLTALLAKFR